MRLEIPDVPPSLNKLCRMHWAERRRLTRDWITWVRTQIHGANSQPDYKVRVAVMMHHARPYDEDNMHGACKPLLDALKHWNLIRDDSPEWLELAVKQEQCPHKQRYTIVEIEPAERSQKP